MAPEKTREKTRSNVASVVGLETVNESKGGRGNYERNASFKNNDGNECQCNADDAMMNATNKRNT